MADTYKLTTLKLFSQTTDENGSKSTTYLYPNIVWENLPVSVRKRITDLESNKLTSTDGTLDVSKLTGFASEITENGTLPTTTGVIYNFVTSQVTTAIADLKNADIKVVDTLPTASADTVGSIYLVAHTITSEDETSTTTAAHNGTNVESSATDYYDEYVTITSTESSEEGGTSTSYSWEKIGNTDIDLSDYYTKTEVDDKISEATSDVATSTNVEALETRIKVLEGYINALTGASISTATVQSNVKVVAEAINDDSLANTSAVTHDDTTDIESTVTTTLGTDSHVTSSD